MSAATLARPLAGPRPGALVAPHHDPRPCVTNPPQWWDTGNEHNARAVRYCRTCPLAGNCLTEDEPLPKGQIRDAKAYNEYGKRVKLCAGCDRPRLRTGNAGFVAKCGCPTREEQAAQRRAEQEATRQAKLAAQQAKARQLQGAQLVDVWVPLHCAGLNIREAAERLGVRPGTLKNALHRARSAGDRRVPQFRAARTQGQVAA